MKNRNLLIVVFILLLPLFFNKNVDASASASLSTSSNTVYVGDTFKVYVRMNSGAAWEFHTSASGPVTGCVINEADSTIDANDITKTFSADCTVTGEGLIAIKFNGNVTSAVDGETVDVSGSKNVYAISRPAPSSNPSTPTPTNPSTNNKNNNNNNSNNNNNNSNTPATPTLAAENNKSTNANLKELSVSGYKLEKVDANNYTLVVPDFVNTITIKATVEDSKSKVIGDGERTLTAGDNNLEVVVTAESGDQNKINIKVTRNANYTIKDLDSLLNNKAEDINITIDNSTVIKAADLVKIKEAKKVVNFNYYDEQNTLIYSWIVDGSKMKEAGDLKTTITFDSNNKEDILRLSNYADGMFVYLKKMENLPTGTKVKLFVGNNFKDSDVLNIYVLDKDQDELKLVNRRINVEDGFITFDVIKATDYFLTTAKIDGVSKAEEVYHHSIFEYIFIVLLYATIAATVGMTIKLKKEQKQQ